MASRQDQLHSYQFMVQRVVAALVMRETDPPRSPFRRVAGATLVGVLIAALGIGGAAAYALIVPSTSSKWRDETAIIVEKDTGALFIYREERLHPVLNQASALLILNRAGTKTIEVSRTALAEAPRGTPLGIPGAPASLPAKTKLHRRPWEICTQREASVLFIDANAPRDGMKLEDRALLVTDRTLGLYLVVHQRKHQIRQPSAILPALVWSGRAQTPVAQAFLHAIPSGADLVVPAVEGRGRKVAGGTVGQLFEVRTGDRVDAFVLTVDGLASVTPLQAALVQVKAQPLTPGEFAALVQDRQVRPLPSGAGMPAEVPELLDDGFGVACTTSDSTITVGNTLPELGAAPIPSSASDAGTVLADRIVVAPGGGALIRTDTGNLSLVTDLGRRHALPDAGVLAGLGYQGVEPVTVPGEFVGLLPAGPALDPQRALSGS
ncbi:type VII secretion protein EccB [Dactylosporangium sp. NPDC005555]|uniref:type VII secretion protein EccB n=1 Tax=Dactylosporangium sp. NPDC005555 TaxID=3154889 RepID=UPI0033B47867